MLRPALLTAAALCLPLLAGCLDESAGGAGAPAALLPGVSNVGGSDKLVTSVFPGKYNLTGPYSRVLEPGALEILPAQEIRVPSALDGEDILMGLHRPDTGEKVPVFVFASPYFGFTMGTNDVTDRVGAFGNLVENFVPHGYAVVGLAVRGTGNSGGCNDLMGPKETADLDQAITWLGTQEWSNGNVAMTGVSYDGSTPWAVASTGNPHLKTIVPISGVPDMYGLMYRNGSAESRGPFLLNLLYYGGNIAVGTMEPQRAPIRAACPEAIAGTGMAGVAGVTGNDPSGFWQERNRKPGVEANYQGSVFSVQGLQDWNVDPSQVVPWVDQLESKGLRTKQLLGQWGHSWPDSIQTEETRQAGRLEAFRADYQEILLRWLDQELKGEQVDTGAPVQVRDSLGRWRNEEHFPPHDTTWTTYHLGGSLLLPEPGPRESAILVPQAGPGIPPNPPSGADLAVRSAARFVLGPVAEETLVVGLPKVHVTVTPQGPGGYLGAYLYDVAPEDGDECGAGRRLGWTTMNLAFHDGGTTRREVLPGETVRAMMEIQPMDGVVEKGHALALCIWVFTETSGTEAGPVTAPADVQMRTPTLPPAPITLEMGGDIESTLILPTVVRGPEVYFTPPVGPEGDAS
jgi:predicted acyl esterase